MNGFQTIFKVCAYNYTQKKRHFEKCFRNLAGAHADLDRMVKEQTTILKWELLADLWRNDDENARVHTHRHVKVKTLSGDEIWYDIYPDNLYD